MAPSVRAEVVSEPPDFYDEVPPPCKHRRASLPDLDGEKPWSSAAA